MIFFKSAKFRQALQLEAGGRYPDARARYRELADGSTGAFRAECLARAGACSTRLGDLALARKLFESARDAAPGDPSHWLNYANACHRLGDGLGADEAYVQALNLAPDRPDILYYQSVYYADKIAKAGLEGARRALRVYLEKAERPGGLAELSALGFPGELPLVFIRNLGLEKQLIPEAEGILREFADRPPANPETGWVRAAALNHLGLLLANAGRYDDAVKAYESSLAAKAGDDVTFNLGMAHVRRHDWDAARARFTAYSKRHPTSPVTTFGLAILAETRGDAAEAVRLFEFFLHRHAEKPPSPAELAPLDIPRLWTRHAEGFVAAMRRPAPGGIHEVHPDDAIPGAQGDVTDRPRGL